MRKLSAALGCLMLATLLAVGGGCGKKGKEASAKGNAPVVKGVTVLAVVSGNVPDLFEAVGTVKARNSALLAARIPATVTAVLVRDGERVAKGKLLATLEANESTAGAAGAAAGVEEALRGLDEAVARKKLADVTFERYQKLLQEQAVTRQEFDGRQTEREVAVQGVARAQARLSQAKEASRAAGTVAGYTRISAPLAGVVTGKALDVGMTVFPGMPLMTVEEEGRYRLEVNAPESLLGKVKTGQTVRVAIDGVAAEQTGKVAEVYPNADPLSRTFLVKVDLTGTAIRSGLYGRAMFSVGEKKGLLVPRGALVERGALISVWVVDKENVARMRLVKTGKTLGDQQEILSGLADGERIVTSGVALVTDGAKVE